MSSHICRLYTPVCPLRILRLPELAGQHSRSFCDGHMLLYMATALTKSHDCLPCGPSCAVMFLGFVGLRHLV